MKKCFILALAFATNFAWSQESDGRQQAVEHGLVFPAIAPLGQEIITGHVLDQLKKHRIHGASVAVLHDGKLAWSKAYGITDISKPKPVTTETLFQCASIGKVITAMAALTLVEAGKLSFDENVNQYLKRWQLPENQFTKKQAVTLRHLLSHTAGLQDEYGFLGYAQGKELPSLLQMLNNEKPSNAQKPISVNRIPGRQVQYSGGGYLIIQLLIEEVSGQPFIDYVQQEVLAPLQMNQTTYDFQPDVNLNLPIARGHRANGKAFKNKKYHMYPEHAAAGPWTTPEDLAKLVLAIQRATNEMDDSLLNQKLINAFLTPYVDGRGLGLILRGIDKPDAFWHSGQNLGYTGVLYGLTESGDGAVVLVNSEGGEKFLQEFVSSVANAYNWPVMKSYQALEISQGEINALIGEYEDEHQSKKLTIATEKGRLYVQPEGSKQSVELLKIGDNHFSFQKAQDYYKLSFTFQSGTARSLTYSESIGKTIELKKVNLVKK